MAYSPEMLKNRVVLTNNGAWGRAQTIYLDSAAYGFQESNLQDPTFQQAVKSLCDTCPFNQWNNPDTEPQCSGLVIYEHGVEASVNLESIDQVPVVEEQANCLPKYRSRGLPQSNL